MSPKSTTIPEFETLFPGSPKRVKLGDIMTMNILTFTHSCLAHGPPQSQILLTFFFKQ